MKSGSEDVICFTVLQQNIWIKSFFVFGLEKNQNLLLSRDPPLADLQNKLIGSRMGPTLKGERINKCSGVSVERATEREREREQQKERERRTRRWWRRNREGGMESGRERKSRESKIEREKKRRKKEKGYLVRKEKKGRLD